MQNFDDKLQTTIQELTTVRDVLRWAVSAFSREELFFGHGTDNAWDEAIALVFFSLHLPHELFSHFVDAKLTMLERKEVLQLLQKRIDTRQPAAYLTQAAWFAGLEFYVDPRVLIPRSPIAELIEKHFEPWVNSENVKRILDLGTGSGCIAIACAAYFPEASVDAIDIEDGALEVAKINIKNHQVEDRVNLIKSNVFSSLTDECYDIIVANPPYVDAAEMAALPPEYQHEPRIALAAGIDGLDIVRNILRNAALHLTADGILIVEVGLSMAALQETFPEVPFLWIDFSRGGDGVFLLTKSQLLQYQAEFNNVR